MTETKKALLIGVNSYADAALPKLSASVRDVEAMAGALARHRDGTDRLNYECTMLRDAAPDGSRLTRAQLRRAITDHFHDFSGDLLLYYSGHGVLGSTGGFITAYDSERDDPGVPMTEIMTLAKNARAREILIILDCCYAGQLGIAADSGRTIFGDSLATIREEMTVIAACTAAQHAVEIGGRSAFTAALVDALEGGAADHLGQVTAGAVYAYARRRFGVSGQRPVYKSHTSDVTVVRRCEATINHADLTRMIGLFPSLDFKLQLDPEYEPEDEHGNVKEPVNRGKVDCALMLKRLRDAGLVKSTDGAQFYWVARRSGTLELTRRGREYWLLTREGKI
ncbi:MAG: caspase family protein [Phycisphaeraceae bacterium]|nr:caspase family protein [Phycisphaeraceae bacterium]